MYVSKHLSADLDDHRPKPSRIKKVLNSNATAILAVPCG